MKYGIVISMLPLIVLCDRAQGDYSLLEKRFAIEGPENSYESLTFNMGFQISDLIEDNMIGYSLYDGHNCKDGGDNDITDNSVYLLHRIRTDNTPTGDGSATRNIKIESKVVPTDIKNSTIYETDSDGNGVVKYCLRIGVYNMDRSDPMSMEVNFLEIPVMLTLRMSGNFQIDAALSMINPLLDATTRGVAVEAYICDYDDNTVPIMPQTQGQAIRVCVTPIQEVLDYGGFMRQIENFDFFRQIPVPTQQAAINPDTGGIAADQLTVVQCRPGSIICAFETMLKADFFTEEGVIAGQGLAYLQLGDEDASAIRTPTMRRMQELLSPNDVLRESPISYQIRINLKTLENLGLPSLVSSNAPRVANALTAAKILCVSLTLLFTIGIIY
eukprot:CAMPEP_0197187008 /NCGR_PEP_ID=MMETSP1423-20130617/15061_1 /TAXON_ID=476441 /ORGANISM="Pseudo-nitzschia heimii, Strain UNC1101" /LENGTH=385 /DNA_ID=CAMNT_0042638479 /DNA_START=225 /DNA_END=1382 /DNA_ORIENTATION=-